MFPFLHPFRVFVVGLLQAWFVERNRWQDPTVQVAESKGMSFGVRRMASAQLQRIVMVMAYVVVMILIPWPQPHRPAPPIYLLSHPPL